MEFHEILISKRALLVFEYYLDQGLFRSRVWDEGVGFGGRG